MIHIRVGLRWVGLGWVRARLRVRVRKLQYNLAITSLAPLASVGAGTNTDMAISVWPIPH